MRLPLPRAVPAVVLLLAATPPAVASDPVRWRTDYNAARKEAADAGLPICLQIGSDDCVYCRKMEATTLRDPGVTGLLGGQFVPLKLDGNRDAAVTRALKVQVYPTTVLAGPDGTIYAVVQGYVAGDAFRDQLKRAAVAAADDLKLSRELADAAAAAREGEYARAFAAAQRVAVVAKGRPPEARADELLEDIEKAAAERLAKANALPADAARAAVAGVSRAFPGTRAAARAERQLAAAGVRFETPVAGLPGPLLGIARELVDKGEYADALDLLGYIASGPAAVPETKAAADAMAAVTGDPAKLATAARQAGEKAAGLQLALSDSHAARGDAAAAVASLELALKLCPGGPKAEQATAKLVKLRGGAPGVPTSQRR